MSLSWKRNDFASPVWVYFCVYSSQLLPVVDPMAEIKLTGEIQLQVSRCNITIFKKERKTQFGCLQLLDIVVFISRATAILCLRLCLCVYMFLVYLLVSVMISRLYLGSALVSLFPLFFTIPLRQASIFDILFVVCIFLHLIGFGSVCYVPFDFETLED